MIRVLLIFLLTLNILIQCQCASRFPRREMDIPEPPSTTPAVEPVSEILDLSDVENSDHEFLMDPGRPDMSLLTSTVGAPQECADACAWTFYSYRDDGERHVVLNFNNRNCFCPKGSTCEYAEDRPGVRAFVHRCQPS